MNEVQKNFFKIIMFFAEISFKDPEIERLGIFHIIPIEK